MNLFPTRISFVIINIFLVGCTANEVGVSKWAAGGAAAGAAGGAVLGKGTNAIYAGAAAGAVTGGVIGYVRNKNTTRYCKYYDEDNYPYEAPCGKP